MRARHLVLLVHLPLVLPVRVAAQGPANAPVAYATALDELRKLAPRGDRVATVSHLVLRRDAAEFRLESGTLQLLTPVAGRTAGAVFIGTGSVTFIPPVPMEGAELRRVLHDSLLCAPISAAVFVFTDSTASELEHRTTFAAPSAAAGSVAAPVGAAMEFLLDGGKQWVEPALMTELLNEGRDSTGFFAGYVKRVKGEDLMVQVNPQEIEEILLVRRGKFPGQRTQIVSQFQRAADLRDSVSSADEHPDRLTLDSYQIEATIKDNLGFSASATVHFRGRRDGNRWARFSLFEELTVDSVNGQGGAPLTFFRPKQSRELWVRLEPVIGRDQPGSFRVAYHGDLIGHGSLIRKSLAPLSNPAVRRLTEQAMDRWAFIKSTTEWFPRYGTSQPADMELTFHTPAGERFASIGRLVESRVDGKVRTTRWVTEAPTQHASFNVGELEEFELKDPRIPPVTVQFNTDAHRYLTDLFKYAPADPQRQVAADVANSLAFFTDLFGPPLFTHYYATEIPYGHGQAFPGLMHLSWWTFQSVSETGEEEIFRAHEMAHQWWGIGVEPADYRDAWLAEGFADFAGMWYMQLILNDNEKYFKRLAERARQIRSAQDDAPPTGIGYRVGQIDPAHYQLMVYQKGAWVVHMLRNLMLEFPTMKEDRFRAMMRDFYTSYRGRHASTRDFQRVVERHFGLGMDWFFDEWVDGTAIPTYTLSWHTEPAPDGKVLLRFRVRQERVPDDFFMPLPLLIELPDQSQIVIRVNMRGAKVEGKLPLSAKPVRLELNPLQSVLAETRVESWK